MISGPETKGKTLNTENKISSSFRPTSENVNVMSTFTINVILVYKWIWWWIKIFLLKKEERLRKREKRRRRKKSVWFLIEFEWLTEAWSKISHFQFSKWQSPSWKLQKKRTEFFLSCYGKTEIPALSSTSKDDSLQTDSYRVTFVL